MAKRNASATRDVPSGLESRRRAAGRAANQSYSKRTAEAVKAGAKLFTEKGYEATTLADVAEALGIDRATLYYYFKSKSEILKSAVLGIRDASKAELLKIRDLDDDARTKVGLVIRRLITVLEQDYPYASLYFQDDVVRSADPDQAWVREMRRDERTLEAVIAGVIEDGQRAGAIRDDVPADLLTKLVLSVNWTYRWYRPRGKYDAAAISAAFEAVLLKGLTPD